MLNYYIFVYHKDIFGRYVSMTFGSNGTRTRYLPNCSLRRYICAIQTGIYNSYSHTKNYIRSLIIKLANQKFYSHTIIHIHSQVTANVIRTSKVIFTYQKLYFYTENQSSVSFISENQISNTENYIRTL